MSVSSQPARVDVDVAVVGAGVVGAAVARHFAAAGRSVAVLERAERPAEGVTSRNSGVIHSGLYYPPGSLKARLCVRGHALLYEWAAAHRVPHAKVGKLVVACERAELEGLEALHANALACGAPSISRVAGDALQALEPGLRGVEALWCEASGIIDSIALTQSLLADASEKGALVITRARVTALDAKGTQARLETERGPISAALVVNAAGLDADEVARMAGVDAYRIYPCRGDYFWLRGPPRRHLLYPVRAKGAAGLGVHLTLGLDGRMRLGPDAEYVAQKDDFSPREEKRESFRGSAERFLGPLRAEDLVYDQAGIRPKLRPPGEWEERDFVVSKDLPALVNLVGIESPGLTAALAIAEHVGTLA